MIKFKFQLHEGTVSFSSWIKLLFYAFSLLCVRFLRFCKRVLIYSKRYLPIVLCVIFFESLIIPVGIHLKKYISWTDGLWDLRTFFLSSILISFFCGILFEESKRRKTLTKQYYTYQSFKAETERFIKQLSALAGVEKDCDILLSEELCQALLDKVHLRIESCKKQNNRRFKELPIIEDSNFIYSTPQTKPETYLKMTFERYFRVIGFLILDIRDYSFIGTIDHATEQLNDIYEDIQKERILIETDIENYTELQLLKFLEIICRRIPSAIADIRRPWRWDIEINTKMRKLIQK